MTSSRILLFLLFACFAVACFSNANGQILNKSTLGASLETSISSAPSREIWIGYRAGFRLKKNDFGLIIYAPELRPAFGNWFRAYGYEQSAKVAFGISHRHTLWEKSRWLITTNTIFQIQRINIYDANFQIPTSYILLDAYPRLQLSSGIGIGFQIVKHLYLLQTIRYGVARGNFFVEDSFVDQWRTNICADISIGFEL